MGISQETEKYPKVTPGLIEHLNEFIGNHPHVVNLLISNDTLLVTDPEQPGKKIRVSQLILQISIRDLHNDLISESSIYQLKEAIYETIGKPLIIYTYLRALMSNNVQKMKDRYKYMCG